MEAVSSRRLRLDDLCLEEEEDAAIHRRDEWQFLASERDRHEWRPKCSFLSGARMGAAHGKNVLRLFGAALLLIQE